MPSWAWVLLWVVLLATVTVLHVRERRHGRRPGSGDRHDHAAVRDAQASAEVRGPHGGASLWG